MDIGLETMVDLSSFYQVSQGTGNGLGVHFLSGHLDSDPIETREKSGKNKFVSK